MLTKRTEETVAENRALYGALFENMIIVDVIKNFNSLTVKPQLTFLRDNNKHEIDLIIELGGKIIPVEIKSSQNISTRFFDTLTWFNTLIENQQDAIVIYAGQHNQKRTKGHALGWKHVNSLMKKSIE